MRFCSVENCQVKHYAKGYCKRHYRSFVRHGNALTTDHIILAKENAPKKTKKIRKRFSREGTCEVEGCESNIKAKRLCDKHLRRLDRHGTTDDNMAQKFQYLEYCIVEECEREHYSFGYCNTHYQTYRELGTPYRAKIIKLCGVKGCNNPLQAKGVCMLHYTKWKKNIALIIE